MTTLSQIIFQSINLKAILTVKLSYFSKLSFYLYFKSLIYEHSEKNYYLLNE